MSTDSVNLANVSYDVKKYVATYLRVYQPKGHQKMAPFVVFGLGKLGIDSQGDSENSTVYKTGGGIKYYFVPHIAVRFDVLIWRWHGQGDLTPRDPYYSLDATLGASFLLGGAK